MTTTIFSVIGANRDDPEQLLLRGDDGRRYIWSAPDSDPAPWDEGDGDAAADDRWVIDITSSVEDTLFL